MQVSIRIAATFGGRTAGFMSQMGKCMISDQTKSINWFKMHILEYNHVMLMIILPLFHDFSASKARKNHAVLP